MLNDSVFLSHRIFCNLHLLLGYVLSVAYAGYS